MLAAGKDVNILGVEHEDVDVLARREHVVEAAVVDVVGPAVAADDPDRSPDEEVGEREQVGRIGIRRTGQRRLQRRDALALHAEVRLGDLRRLQEADTRSSPIRGASFCARPAPASVWLSIATR